MAIFSHICAANNGLDRCLKEAVHRARYSVSAIGRTDSLAL